jgi:hypothetical protein
MLVGLCRRNFEDGISRIGSYRTDARILANDERPTPEYMGLNRFDDGVWRFHFSAANSAMHPSARRLFLMKHPRSSQFVRVARAR